MKELLLDETVNTDLGKIKSTIRDSKAGGPEGKLNIYQLVVKELSDGTRNSEQQISYLDSFERALATFKAASVALRTEMDIVSLEERLGSLEQGKSERQQIDDGAEKELAGKADQLRRQIIDSVFFSNRYSLYLAGEVGLSLLGSKHAEVKNRFTFGTKYDASKESDTLVSLLATQASDDFRRAVHELRSQKPDDQTLKYVLECLFTSWTNQFNYDTFKDVAQTAGVSGLYIKSGKHSVKEGVFSTKFDRVVVDERFMRVGREDVIGSKGFCNTLWSNLTRLACYDVEHKENPFDPAGVIFVYGESGGGKTFNSHAHIQSLAQLCRSKGIPLWAFTHSTTDYASHYQNLTANQLSTLAKEISDFAGIVVMYVADADNIFQSRKDPRLTAEQQQTLAVYFKMFDGTMIPKNGKFMAIMDANYIEGIDDATKSRLFDEVLELKRFDKPEDFAELAKRAVTKGVDLAISDEEWRQVGEYILASPLSNREVTHITKRLRRDFEVPESLLNAAYDAKVAYRNEHLRSITKDKVISECERYIATRLEVERASAMSMRSDDRERFLSYLLEKKPMETKTE